MALALEAAPGSVRVIATDCSAAALDVARAERGGARASATRVALRQGDLLAPLAGERLDAVVSNPPTSRPASWDALEPCVRDFEPREALESGEDGLAAIRELVARRAGALRAGGCWRSKWMRRARRAAAALAGRGCFASSPSRGSFGRPRYVRARRPVDGSD